MSMSCLSSSLLFISSFMSFKKWFYKSSIGNPYFILPPILSFAFAICYSDFPFIYISMNNCLISWSSPGLKSNGCLFGQLSDVSSSSSLKCSRCFLYLIFNLWSSAVYGFLNLGFDLPAFPLRVLLSVNSPLSLSFSSKRSSPRWLLLLRRDLLVLLVCEI